MGDDSYCHTHGYPTNLMGYCSECNWAYRTREKLTWAYSLGGAQHKSARKK